MVALDRLPTPAQMMRHLDGRVAGQERAQRALTAAVYRHYLGLAQRDAGGHDFGPQHVLLIGPSGSGKTLMVRTLAAYLGVPVAFCAATSLVEAGYVGEQVESMLYALMQVARHENRPADRGIVFVDEFDKVRLSPDVGRDVSGQGVQNALLSLFDGTRTRFRHRDVEFTLDTSRILFLCSGAFAGLPDVVRRRRARRGGMGFRARVRETRAVPDAEALERLAPEDLIRFGFIPELVGRFDTVTTLHPLGEADLVRILDGVEGSVLDRWRRQFELHGLRLEFGAEAAHAIARRAIDLGTGARALARLVGETLASVSWRLPELAEEGVRAVRVSEAAANGEELPDLVRETPEAPPVPFPSVEHLRMAALGGAARARATEAGAQRSPAQVAARIALLKHELDFQRLRAERLFVWLEFERQHEAREVLWALEAMRERRISPACFAEALPAADTPHLPAVMHYAAYLDERARAAPKRGPRRPRGAAPADEAPKLEF